MYDYIYAGNNRLRIRLGIHHGGWVPRGTKTKNGRLADTHRVQEMSSISYPERTEMSVFDSDGTLNVSHGKLIGGSDLHNSPANNIISP